MNKIRDSFDVNEKPGKNTPAGDQFGLLSSDVATLAVPISAGTQEYSVWKPFNIEAGFQTNAVQWPQMVNDLLHQLDSLAVMLRSSLESESWLNAYLLAAGINQIVEDYLHHDLFLLRKSARYLEEWLPVAGSLAARSIKHLANLSSRMINRKPLTRWLVTWQLRWSDFVSHLSELEFRQPGHDSPDERGQVKLEGETLMADIQFFPPALQKEFMKLPSCFRSFDQRPEDIRRITDEFSIHWTAHERLIYVVGIRTSGSYLAPIYSAFLKARGYSRVNTITLRPERALLTDEVQAIKQLVKSNGLVLVVDDPPISGSTLYKVVTMLEEQGVPSLNIVLLLQLFGDSGLPSSLQKYPSVLLSWPNWTIHQSMQSKVVKETLSRSCLPTYKITKVNPIEINILPVIREHASAWYCVELVNTATKQSLTRTIQVKGLGLGYFGEHTISVIQKLPEFSARVIAIEDGLLFQEIPSPEMHLTAEMLTSEQKWLDGLLDYVISRNQRLNVSSDSSIKLRGRNSAWEVASNLLSRAFGRGWPLARVLFLDRFIKQVMAAGHPSVIDGNMSLPNWYVVDEQLRSMVKMEIAEKDFSHLDLYSYDPVNDLAFIAQELDRKASSNYLSRQYESRTGDIVSSERWMLNQLIHIWDKQRQGIVNSGSANRSMAHVLQRHFSQLYFDDIEMNTAGALCFLDMDGVLETNALGFASLTHRSAMSLRALSRHGYRVVLATGRSLDEVKERCDTYRLAGGVAEYGSVLYSTASGQTHSLLSANERSILNSLRRELSGMPGIYVDPDYRHAVRAYCLVGDNSRVGLSDESISRVLSEEGLLENIHVIRGKSQTDFITKGIDKGRGLLEWIKRYDIQSGPETNQDLEHRPAALAVGDSLNDLPMLNMARLAYAPAHASSAMKNANIRITRHPYQAGLYDAVSELIGHLPGTCSLCRPAETTPQTNIIQEILSVQENGQLNMLWQLIKLSFTSDKESYGSH